MELIEKRNHFRKKISHILAGKNIRNYFGIIVLNIFIKGLAYTMIDSYFIYFYTEFLGCSVAAMSAILSIGIVIDGASDVGMGFVLDQVITRFGKAKHWLIWMGVPLALSMVLIFYAPQNASAAVKIIWAALTYNVYCCCMTAVRIPSQSMATLSSDKDEVRTMFSWCSSCGSNLAGIVTSAVLVSTLKRFGGETISAYRHTQLLFAVATAVIVIACGYLFHEKRDGNEWRAIRDANRQKGLADAKRRKSDKAKQIYYIVHNRYWWIYLILHFFEACMDGVLYGSIAYFCKYVLNDTAAVAVFLAIASSAQMIGQMIDLPLMGFVENLTIALIGVIVMVAGSSIGLVSGVSSMFLLEACIAVRHFGNGMFNGMRGAMLPRIVDYGEWKFDVRQDGMVQGGNSVMQKISSAIITIIVGVMLSSSGYVGGEAVSAATIGVLQFILLKLPFFTAILNLVFFLMFDLSEQKIRKMRKEINQRREQASARGFANTTDHHTNQSGGATL